MLKKLWKKFVRLWISQEAYQLSKVLLTEAKGQGNLMEILDVLNNCRKKEGQLNQILWEIMELQDEVYRRKGNAEDIAGLLSQLASCRTSYNSYRVEKEHEVLELKNLVKNSPLFDAQRVEEFNKGE